MHFLPNLQFELQWKAGGCARVTTGPKRPHRGVCPGPNIPLKGRQGFRVSIPDSPGESGLAWRGVSGLSSSCGARGGLFEACVQDLIFLSREDRDPGFPFQTPPGSQDWPGGEAKDSAFLSSRDTDLLEPTEWTQGCRARKFEMSHGCGGTC